MENIIKDSIKEKSIVSVKKKKNITNWNGIFIATIILFVFALIFILNFNTQYTSDDYRYHFFYDSYMVGESTHLLTGILEIPASMWNHYNLWGGRIVAHSIVQFFMLFDKSVFNVFNSLIFVALGLLIYYHIETYFKKWRPLFLGTIYMAMWMFLPEFGLSALWVSGSCNYLWTTVLILLFLVPFRKYEYNKDKNKVIMPFIMVPFGFLAGCTNENSGGAMILLACFYIIYWRMKKIKIPIWSITGIVSACVGVIFLIIAPGNSGRGNISISLDVLKEQLHLVLDVSYSNLTALFITLFVCTSNYIDQNKLSIKDSIKLLILPAIYVIAGAASVFVLIVAPTIASRSWIWDICFMIIAIGNILVRISFKHWLLSFERLIAFIYIIFICIPSYTDAYSDIRKTYLQVSNEINEINQQKEVGIKDVLVTGFYGTANKYNAFNATANFAGKDSWFNRWMAKYYDVNSIDVKVKNKE